MNTPIRAAAMTGESWDRCYAISAMNPAEGRRVLQFHEEKVVRFGAQLMRQEAGTCLLEFEPEAEIPLLDELGRATGDVITHAGLYAMLRSAYWQAVRLRDEALAPGEKPKVMELSTLVGGDQALPGKPEAP